jgi:hypothetical protein
MLPSQDNEYKAYPAGEKAARIERLFRPALFEGEVREMVYLL